MAALHFNHMHDRSPFPYPPKQGDKDAFGTWLKQGLQHQFRQVDAVPADLMALIDAAPFLDDRLMAEIKAT